MNRQHYKSALVNLRKCSRLEAKMEAIQEQLNDLEGDQFYFEEEAFNAALRDYQAELENRGINPATGEIHQEEAA